MSTQQHAHLTLKIVIAMILGIILGIIFNHFPQHDILNEYLTDGILDLGGKVFINILKMLVVPVVFVSLVCGTFSLNSNLKLGNIALKTIILYTLTTMLAISIALTLSKSLHIGAKATVTETTKLFELQEAPSLKQTLLNIFPSNPVQAMAEGNMLQIIVFAILFGVAITKSGEKGERLKRFFKDLDTAIMNLVSIVIRLAPYGVFCLVTKVFAENGLPLFLNLGGYFATVIAALLLHLFITYSLFLRILAKLNPLPFFRKMASAAVFAFSTSSSNASIPVVLNTVEKKLGVKESIASFVVPLGATINMDGTAIMQGVATVFIANAYNIHLSLAACLKVVLIATLASIGTAGVPSVGLITLMMVLMQVGLPVQGIALIIGIDRVLDMIRTAVNISGDAMVACVLGVQEKQFSHEIYQGNSNDVISTGD